METPKFYLTRNTHTHLENNKERTKVFVAISVFPGSCESVLSGKTEAGECVEKVSSHSQLCFWKPGRTDLLNCQERGCETMGSGFRFTPVGNMKDLNKWSQMPQRYCD